MRSSTCFQEGARTRTLAIVGAGFSGTALAIQMLRDPPTGIDRIALIERSGRFGPGLAYSDDHVPGVLNVPAARMSIDEDDPVDFLRFLWSCGSSTGPDEFVSRWRYGRYLEVRLDEAAAASTIRLVRLTAEVRALSRAAGHGAWRLELDDGSNVFADATVLAIGHFAPRGVDALRPLAGAAGYAPNPWSRRAIKPGPERVLLVGTGLTMADLACALLSSASPPREIVAISRRGLLSRTRRIDDAAPASARTRVDGSLGVRGLVRHVRSSIAHAALEGADWRDVVAGVRRSVPRLWRGLEPGERRRFLRHVQPYWEAHRHQLPPSVGHFLRDAIERGRLKLMSGRVVSARTAGEQVVIGFRPRGSERIEVHTFDRVIDCSGPCSDLRRLDSALVRSLLSAGCLTPDPHALGLEVDAEGRPLGRGGAPVSQLYYLGPWLRARDFEATAVQELRRHAARLARHLRSQLTEDSTTHAPRERSAAGRSRAGLL
jgi:uncharacterized NAD(P)/FAD-binding protein YdhS